MAELNLKKDVSTESSYLSLTSDTSLTHETSEEFALPDYVPTIQRLLSVRAQILPESKYLSDTQGGTSLEFEGTVTFLVIYTDEEGNLCSLPLSSSYEASTILNAHPTTVFIDTSVDSVSTRVLAPRKLSIKTRLKSKITGWEEKSLQEKIEGKSTADELFLERETKAVPVMSIKPVALQNIKMSDRIDVAENTSPTPLWCDATLSVGDVRVQNNSISVRGEALIKCICNVDGEIKVFTKSLPLAEEIESSGASLGDSARIVARCVSLSVSCEEKDTGTELFFDLMCELEGELMRNSDLNITTDCYSTKYETDEEYGIAQTYRLVKAQNTSFTLNESLKRKSKDLTEVNYVSFDPVCEKTDFKGGKAIVSGHVSITVIGKSTSDGYGVEAYELPYKYATEIGDINGELACRCDMLLKDGEARFDGDKLVLSIQLCPCLMMMEKKQQSVLLSATLKKDKEIKKDAGCVRVYFPKEGDTLWEIAKKYHVTKSQIEEQNSISGDISGVKNLII